MKESAQSSRIDIVFDVYNEIGIKDAEQCNRGTDFGVHFKEIVSGQIVCQWRKFLANTRNKTSLIKFLVQEWMFPSSTAMLQDKQLFVTCESKCYMVNQNTNSEISELESSHEEADTCLILHTAHVAKCGIGSVIIIAEDTDVFLP